MSHKDGPGGGSTPRGPDHEGTIFMATEKFSASFANAHPSTKDHDDTVEAHYASLERPHACTEGVVYIGRLVEEPGTREEVEVIEAVPCRRCAEEAR